MKICNLTSVHPRYDIRVFIKECFCMAEMGHEVALVVADGKADEIKNKVSIFGVPKVKNRLGRMVYSTWKVYKKAKEVNANLYCLHDPELLPIGLLLKKKGKKVVFDSHECYQEAILRKRWIPRFFRHIVAAFYKQIEGFLVKRLSGVMAATEHIGDILSQYNKNVFILHNYALLREFSSFQKLKSGYNGVLFLGNICEDHAILNLIRSFTYLPKDIYLCLLGPFTTESLLKECKNLPTWNKVKYYGRVSREQITDFSKNCFCGAAVTLPSKDCLTSNPNKLFEYMAMRLPIVASKFPSLLPMVQDCQSPMGICVNTLDPKEIAEAILKLYENPELAQTMGKNGRKAFEEKYNFESECKSLDQFYKKL